jgi:DNA-binding MarR family transcriptional regulator
MSKRDDQWADELHAVFMDMVGLVNRPEPDAAMLKAAGVELDRALFPLLSRIGLKAPISVVELADIAGKDHSTVSRQVAKLEALGLVARVPSETDQRVRHLVPSRKGEAMLGRLRVARRKAIAGWAKDWDRADREKLLEMLKRLARIGSEMAGRSKQP